MRDKHKKALRIDELNMIVGGHTSEGDPTRLKKIECPLCHTFFDADVSQPYAICPEGDKIIFPG